MSLSTFSKFYFDFNITEDFLYLNFKEGAGPELSAQVEIGSFSMTQIASKIAQALNIAGALTYTCTVSRSTRAFTISATGTFSLLVASGSQTATSAFSVIGFFGADRTGSTSYTGDAAGRVYEPQFILQSYKPSRLWKKAVDATVKKTTSGKRKVVSFGEEQFVGMNIQFINDMNGDNNWIRHNPTGVDDAQIFMDFLITKAPVEFMEDENNVAVFETILLEDSPDEKDGVGYMLKEMTGRNFPDYWETGDLKFVVVEE